MCVSLSMRISGCVDCGLLFVLSTPFYFCLYSVGRSRQRVSRMSAKSQMSKLLDQLMGQNRDGEFSAVFKPILKYWSSVVE